jgi:hypothetical protein
MESSRRYQLEKSISTVRITVAGSRWSGEGEGVG